MPAMPDSTTTQTRRADLPLAGRLAPLQNFQRADPAADAAAPLATVELIFSAGAGVRRYDWLRDRVYTEELVVEDGAIRLDRIIRGAPLLDNHSSWSLSDQLGVVDKPQIQDGKAYATATFSRREQVAGIVQDVADGIVRNVSVGYVRHQIEMVPPVGDGDLWTYRVTDWEPMEVSLVPVPADMDAQIVGQRSQQPGAPEPAAVRTFPCEFIERAQPKTPTVGATAETSKKETRLMKPENAAGGTAEQETEVRAAAPAAAVAPAAPAVDAAAAQAAAIAAEQQRAADITELCQRHSVAALATGLIRAGASVDAARSAVLEELARRDAAAGGHRNVRVQTVTDEAETRAAGLQEAILNRIDPRAELTDNGRQFRGMSLIEIGRDLLEASGRNTRGLSRLEIASQMLQVRAAGYMGTGDFANLLANVAGRRLRAAYEQAASTYQVWARRAPNAPDFKDITVVGLSGAPELLRTNEHGEFKYGTLSDGAEKYSVVTYGRIVALTRQAIINDDLRGFDRLIQAFGNSASRLENRLVYSQLIDNPAMADTVALFHADHGNLGTAKLAGIDALGTARAAMRKQTGMQGEKLNIAPRYLIVPPELEQAAYQYTSSQFVPAKAADVNEFRAGGRTALEPVVEPVLNDATANGATAWYMAADSAAVDTVEYCYLDGAEGPVIESETGFEVDGVSLKARLDFAAKVVDHRGLYKSAGTT